MVKMFFKTVNFSWSSKPRHALIGLLFSFLIGGQVFSQNVSANSSTLTATIEKDGAKLQYSIFMEKDSFFLYEPVRIEVWVKNVSNKSARIYSPFIPGWIVTTASGKEVEPAYSVSISAGLVELKAGDSLGGPDDLSRYGAHLSGIQHVRLIGFPVGNYKAYYQGVPKESMKLIEFHSVQPAGREAEALKAFQQALKPFGRPEFERADAAERLRLMKQEVSDLRAFADRYLGSIYSAQALSLAALTAWNILNDKEQGYQITKRMIKFYPEEASYRLHILKAYYEDKRDLKSLHDELDRIIQQNAHPKLTAAAREALKQLENRKRE